MRILAVFLMASLAGAQATKSRIAEGFDAIQVARLKADLTFLSSDALEGRRSLERGSEVAIQWIASEFAKAGLKPLVGESYLQPVPLIEFTADRGLTSLVVRTGWVAVVQGLVGPAIAFRAGDDGFFRLLAGLGVFSLGFGLLTVAQRRVWIVALIACGLMGFLALFGLLHAPLLVICMALALLEWRLVSRSAPLERDAWLLRKP